MIFSRATDALKEFGELTEAVRQPTGEEHGDEFMQEPKRTEEIQKDQFTEDDYARMKTIEMNRFGRGADEFGNRKQRRRFAALNRK